MYYVHLGLLIYIYQSFYYQNVNQINEEDKESDQRGVLAKNDIHFARFCLILQALIDVSNQEATFTIGKEAINGAGKLVAYFNDQSKKAMEYVKKNKKQKLIGSPLLYFEALPDEFNRKEANNVANSLDIKLSCSEKHLEKFRELELVDYKYNNYKKIIV